MRRPFIALFIALSILSAGLPAAKAAERPNLLLIMTDNQSPSLLGAYGNTEVRTPNIDELARRGMLFERAYAASGVCSPSRAVLMTGRMPSANGVHNGLPVNYPLPGYSAINEFRNLPQTLADAGYRTGMVGKYHLGDQEEPQLGFDFWVTFRGGHTSSFTTVDIIDNDDRYNVSETDEHLTDLWTRRAIDFVEQQDAKRPFFLWLSFNGPYILPPTVNEAPVSRFAGDYERKPPAMPQQPVHAYLREWAKRVPEIRGIPEKPVGGTYPWAAIDALNNQRAMVNVAAETTHVDDGIGRLLAALDRAGLAENTLIVFLSDQGSAYGQKGLWGNSSWGSPSPAYNANMQVPLILVHRGKIPAETRRTEMINQFDMLPTLLDYLGLADRKIADAPGESFAPVLRAEATDWDNEVFFEYITTRVIQTDRWKYTKRFLASPNEFYDLQTDPGETTNLIDDPDYADVVAELDTRLTQFFTDYTIEEFDLWRGGTGKGLVFYGGRNKIFSEAFPNWREPFFETKPAFRDR